VILAFCVSAMHLQSFKAPWVDECYSYYGVSHDSFSEFFTSMLTGINFSPPLYFSFNFIIQLFLPISIDLLRIESALWSVLGTILTFLISRKAFGNTPAIMASLVVISQSSLLLQQSLEARQYTMFFACGSWTLYELNRFRFKKQNLKDHVLFFSSHLSLCLVHYLGIIFSGFLVLALIFSNKERPITKRVPHSIYLSWCIAITAYIFLLYHQSSHLNTWNKENGLNSLLSIYNDSIFILSLIIPAICFIFRYKIQKQKNSNSPNSYSILIVTSFFWLAIPLIFWVLSHGTDYNLFKDRYFIPKEAALIVIIAFIINKFQTKFLVSKRSKLPLGAIVLLSLFITAVEFKRSLFATNPERNFHHWILVNSNIQNKEFPFVFMEDPLYFPNNYIISENTYFLLNNKNLYSIYSQFSRRIKVVNYKELNEFDSFILVSAKDDLPEFESFKTKDLGKLHELLPFVYTIFERKSSSESSPPE
jgi:hypothetical protein